MTTSGNQRINAESLPLFAEHLRRGAKPFGEWKCGVELELFGYEKKSLTRLDASAVQRVLAALAGGEDKTYFDDYETLVEVCVNEIGHVTIEPGGQIEFSGHARQTIRELENDLRIFMERLNAVAAAQGLMFLAIGFDPLRSIREQHWFPKMRYDLMRPVLASKGTRAWDMMTRTCAVQLNLDYRDEEDLADKFILGNRIAPLLTAMFANSPFEGGQPSGYKSTRAASWLKTDATRCGLSPLALDNFFSPDDFVAYALNVPMIFVRRGQRYSGSFINQPFAEFLRKPQTDEFAPIFQDWTDHLTTIFTDARLKQYIELRSVDCQDIPLTLAAVALCKGLFYDRTALREALRLVPHLAANETAQWREAVARDALAARELKIETLSLAKQILTLSTEGLRRIAPDEINYLDPIRQLIIEDEICPADVLLRNWRGSWHGSIVQAMEYVACR